MRFQKQRCERREPLRMRHKAVNEQERRLFTPSAPVQAVDLCPFDLEKLLLRNPLDRACKPLRRHQPLFRSAYRYVLSSHIGRQEMKTVSLRLFAAAIPDFAAVHERSK